MQFEIRNPIRFLKRSDSQQGGYAWLADLFNRSTKSGTNVNELTALQLTAVAACIRIISTSIAKVPKYLLLEEENGDLIKDKKSQYYFQLSEQPSELYNKFNFDRMMLTYRLLWGNAYAYNHRNKYGEVYKRTILYPWAVYPVFMDGKLQYYNGDARYPEIPNVLKPHEIYHLKATSTDGYAGKSPIRQHAESIGINIASENYGAKFFGNSGIPAGFIKVPDQLSAAGAKQIKDSWMNQTGGDNQNGTAVLGNGSDFVRLSIPPEEAQFLATRQYGVREIASIYGVPLHMLADLERATFSNIEHQSIQFVSSTLTDYSSEIEWEDESKILTEEMRLTHEVRYDFSDLLKGDVNSQMDFVVKGIQNGLFSVNDGRKRFGENQVAGGDQRFIGVNMIPIEDIKNFYNNKSTAPTQRQIGFAKELERLLEQQSIKNGIE